MPLWLKIYLWLTAAAALTCYAALIVGSRADRSAQLEAETMTDKTPTPADLLNVPESHVPERPYSWCYDPNALETPPRRVNNDAARRAGLMGFRDTQEAADHERLNMLRVQRLRDCLRPSYADQLPPEFAPAAGWPEEQSANPSPETVQSWDSRPAARPPLPAHLPHLATTHGNPATRARLKSKEGRVTASLMLRADLAASADVGGLSQADADILAEVGLERIRQGLKWGSQNHTPADWLMILGEETGEANKAALEAKFSACGDGTLADYRRELVEAAAVAVAAIKNHDERAGGFTEIQVFGEPEPLVSFHGDAPAHTAPASEIDALAQLIRQVDGRHDLGAGALAEALHVHGVRAYTVARDEAEDAAYSAAQLPQAAQLSQDAAYVLSGLAHRLTVTREAEAETWNLEYETDAVSHSGVWANTLRTGRATLTLQFTDLPEAARYREAVAAAKPMDGVTVDPATFEKLRLMAAVREDSGRLRCVYCGETSTASGGFEIYHAESCPGLELERLAELERKG